MQTQVSERQNICEIIDTLSDAAIGKLSNYIDFFRYEERIEELEEAEDIAYINSHKDDPVEPFEIADFN